jgi:salicylate hydroxylase
MTYRRIAVVGAGIGGLTAAVALAGENVRCEVFERDASLPGAGGGIQISPNAAVVLHALGLSAAFDTAVRPEHRELRRWQDDGVIARMPLGRTAEPRYPAPYYTLRRSVLCRALLAAARRAHGPDAVRFGRRCVGVRDHGAGVVVRLDDGAEVGADAVIGADGLHSAVRGLLHPDRIRYSGHVAYRAVFPVERAPWLAGPARVLVWLGPGRHVVAYPIDGGRSLNLVATVPAPVPPAAAREVSGGELLAAYAGWHPAVRGLLAVAGRFDRHCLFDRPPLPSWQRGRIAVLGDAAHPMLPFVAQGAAQAIEDAGALARCVREPDGFARYEALRRERAGRVVALARAGLRDHHLPDGPEQRARDRALAGTSPAALDWLYGYRRAAAEAIR